jgi:hypothetical protein
MTQKEKAKELLIKIGYIEGELMAMNYIAKRHALIAVDEIWNALESARVFEEYDYWQEVKQEIEKL